VKRQSPSLDQIEIPQLSPRSELGLNRKGNQDSHNASRSAALMPRGPGQGAWRPAT
jgi:hypothetical protein